MAIRLRTSVTALAIVISLALAPTLTNQPVFALGCGIDPIITLNIGTAEAPPYSPESLNDTAFLAYSAVGGPSASLDIPVTRYLAPADGTGKIPVVRPGSCTHPPFIGIYPTHLESLGIVGSKAILKFAYSFREYHYLNYDKNKREDAPADSGSPVRPSRLRFNGTDVTDRLTVTAAKTVSTSEPGHLTTTLNGVLATMEMNIWEINFPTAPGVNGNPPSPGVNTLEWQYEEGTIGISQGECLNYTTYSGAAVSWAGIEIKALAPVVLVHGIGGDASDWEEGVDEDFEPSAYYGVTATLARQHVTYWNQVNLTKHGARDENAKELSQFFRKAATELGAKGIHVIAHSKGGLDTRSFLKNEAADLNDATGIHLLSLSTLSTPHQGTVLADLMVWQRADGRVTSRDPFFALFLDSDHKLGLANKIPFLSFGPEEPGLSDLQTTQAVGFNITTPFPTSVTLLTFGADADLNASPDPGYFAQITAGNEPPNFPNAPNETSPMIEEVNFFLNRTGIRERATAMYQIGLSTTGISYDRKRQYRSFFRRRWEYNLIGVPGVGDIAGPGDLAVTIPSSRLSGEAAHFDFTGANGRNHTNLRSSPVIAKVLETIRPLFPLVP